MLGGSLTRSRAVMTPSTMWAFGAKAFRGYGHVVDGERNVRAQGSVLAILLFGLVAVEFVGAKPHPGCDRGRLFGLHGPVRQFRHDRGSAVAGAQLAGRRAAKLEEI